MPNRPSRGKRTPAANGRASISMSGGYGSGASGIGETAINPNFDPEAVINPPQVAGDVNYNYSGNPQDVVRNPAIVTNPVLDARSWWGRNILKQPNSANVANTGFNTSVALSRVGESMKAAQAPVVNGDFFQPSGHDYNDPGFDARDFRLPFSGNSTGSAEGNKAFATSTSERMVASDLAHKEDVLKHQTGLSFAPQEAAAEQNRRLGEFWGNKGISPDMNQFLSPTNEANVTSGMQAGTAANNNATAEAVARAPFVGPTASSEASLGQKVTEEKVGVAGTPEGGAAIRSSYLESLMHPGLMNDKLAEITAPQGSASFNPRTGASATGAHVTSTLVPNMKEGIDLSTGKPKLVPTGTQSREANYVAPSIRVGGIKNPNPSPPQAGSNTNRVTTLQPPNNSLEDVQLRIINDPSIDPTTKQMLLQAVRKPLVR